MRKETKREVLVGRLARWRRGGRRGMRLRLFWFVWVDAKEEEKRRVSGGLVSWSGGGCGGELRLRLLWFVWVDARE